jgi:hypothetical protein
MAHHPIADGKSAIEAAAEDFEIGDVREGGPAVVIL